MRRRVNAIRTTEATPKNMQIMKIVCSISQLPTKTVISVYAVLAGSDIGETTYNKNCVHYALHFNVLSVTL